MVKGDEWLIQKAKQVKVKDYQDAFSLIQLAASEEARATIKRIGDRLFDIYCKEDKGWKILDKR